jgi:two-component system, cell cycle sensor histidine kinase and response regulator CckA
VTALSRWDSVLTAETWRRILVALVSHRSIVSERAAPPAPASPPVPASGGSFGVAGLPFAVQVLVVDDDSLARRAITRTLAAAGYAVVEAAGGSEALQLLESTHIPVDLLVTDVQMPGVMGYDLVERIRRAAPALPVLYVSGEWSFGSLAGPGDPATRFLPKPFTPAELLERVGQLVHGLPAA